MVSPKEAELKEKPEAPEKDHERVATLETTGILSGHAREELDALAKRAADVFNVGFAVISTISKDREYIIGQSKHLPGARTHDGTDMITMPRDEAICNHVMASGESLVVPDTQRDPRFAEHPAVRLWDTRFYAGAPLRTSDDSVLGALCLLDTEPHALGEQAVELLESMALDVTALITGDAKDAAKKRSKDADTSATVGQRVPE